MNKPDTVPDTAPTQVRKPWRATFRTSLTALVALIPLIPQIAAAADIDEIPTVASFVAIAAAVSRVLSLNGVEAWLDKYIPILAAEPYEGKHRKDKNKDEPD
jgi:hypothetical protein